MSRLLWLSSALSFTTLVLLLIAILSAKAVHVFISPDHHAVAKVGLFLSEYDPSEISRDILGKSGYPQQGFIVATLDFPFLFPSQTNFVAELLPIKDESTSMQQIRTNQFSSCSIYIPRTFDLLLDYFSYFSVTDLNAVSAEAEKMGLKYDECVETDGNLGCNYLLAYYIMNKAFSGIIDASNFISDDVFLGAAFHECEKDDQDHQQVFVIQSLLTISSYTCLLTMGGGYFLSTVRFWIPGVLFLLIGVMMLLAYLLFTTTSFYQPEYKQTEYISYMTRANATEQILALFLTSISTSAILFGEAQGALFYKQAI